MVYDRIGPGMAARTFAKGLSELISNRLTGTAKYYPRTRVKVGSRYLALTERRVWQGICPAMTLRLTNNVT